MDFEDHYSGGFSEWQANYEDDFDEFDRNRLLNAEKNKAEKTFDLFNILNELMGSTPSNIIYDYIYFQKEWSVSSPIDLTVMPINERFNYQVNNSEWTSKLVNKHDAKENTSLSDWRKDVQQELERFSHKGKVRDLLIQTRIFNVKIDIIIIEYLGKPCENCLKTEQEGDIHYENCRKHHNFRPLPLVTPTPWFRGKHDPIYGNRLMLEDRVQLYEWHNGELIKYKNPSEKDLKTKNDFINNFTKNLLENGKKLLGFNI